MIDLNDEETRAYLFLFAIMLMYWFYPGVK